MFAFSVEKPASREQMLRFHFDAHKKFLTQDYYGAALILYLLLLPICLIGVLFSMFFVFGNYNNYRNKKVYFFGLTLWRRSYLMKFTNLKGCE